MAKHGDLFTKLSAQQLQSYEQQARTFKRKSSSQLLDEKEDVVAKLHIAQQRLAEWKEKRRPLTLDSCRLTDPDMDDFCRVLKGVQSMKRKELNAKIAEWNTAPTPATRSEVGSTVPEVTEGWRACPEVPRPSWLSLVVKQRVEFAGTLWGHHCGER